MLIEKHSRVLIYTSFSALFNSAIVLVHLTQFPYLPTISSLSAIFYCPYRYRKQDQVCSKQLTFQFVEPYIKTLTDSPKFSIYALFLPPYKRQKKCANPLFNRIFLTFWHFEHKISYSFLIFLSNLSVLRSIEYINKM